MNETTHERDLSDPVPVLDYWFGIDPDDPQAFGESKKRWFSGGAEVDAEIGALFGAQFEAAASGALEAWESNANSRLALILLFDQFPRNIFRASPKAFAYDNRAFALAESGVESGLDLELSVLERVFFYMPYQHCESRNAQRRAVDLFEALAKLDAREHVRDTVRSFAGYARQHRDIVERFGRFPHRNRLLGRSSTDEEAQFLQDGGPTFGQ